MCRCFDGIGVVGDSASEGYWGVWDGFTARLGARDRTWGLWIQVGSDKE